MIKFLQARRKGQAIAGTLYLAIVAQARQPALYRDFLVPDTVEGRFELVALHVWLVLRRLRPGGRPGGRHAGRQGIRTGQALLDYMFDDLDRSIREIGIGDMSIGKYMKRLGKSFYGRAAAYDKCLDAGDLPALAAAVRRNILGTSEADPAQLDAASLQLAGYIAECDAALAAQSVEWLCAGEVTFAAPVKAAACPR